MKHDNYDLIKLDIIENIDENDKTFFSFINKSSGLFILGILTEMFIMYNNNNTEQRYHDYNDDDDNLIWWSNYCETNNKYKDNDLYDIRNINPTFH